MGAELQIWLHPLATLEVEQKPRIINGFAGFALLSYGNVLKKYETNSNPKSLPNTRRLPLMYNDEAAPVLLERRKRSAPIKRSFPAPIIFTGFALPCRIVKTGRFSY